MEETIPECKATTVGDDPTLVSPALEAEEVRIRRNAIESVLIRRAFEAYDGSLDKALQILNQFANILSRTELDGLMTDHPRLWGLVKLYESQGPLTLERRLALVRYELRVGKYGWPRVHDPEIHVLASALLRDARERGNTVLKEHYRRIADCTDTRPVEKPTVMNSNGFDWRTKTFDETHVCGPACYETYFGLVLTSRGGFVRLLGGGRGREAYVRSHGYKPNIEAVLMSSALDSVFSVFKKRH